MFFDRRLPTPGGKPLFGLIEKLADALRRTGAASPMPNLGNIGVAAPAHPHPQRGDVLGGPVARRRHRQPAGPVRSAPRHWRGLADTVRETILERCWNEKRQAFSAGVDTDDMDASVLLLPELGLIDAQDPRFISTVAAIEKELVHGRHVLRYAAPDDFGLPEAEFLVCRFWLIDARNTAFGAGARKRASVSPTRSPCATNMDCSPRISTATPASSGAIFPRPIPWPD